MSAPTASTPKTGIWSIFGWSFVVTAACLAVAYLYGGFTAGLVLCAILAVLEVSLSFDNAVVNATVLERMSQFWQRMFLTVGIVIAVFGMRLLFPLLIVGITASMNPVEAFDLAINDGAEYGRRLAEAHPAIAAFGGLFLLMLFLDFVLEERKVTWLGWIERPLAKLGRLDVLSVVVGLVTLVVATELFVHDTHERSTVMISGVLGLVAYLLTNGLGELFEAGGDAEDEVEHDHGHLTLKHHGPSETAKAAGKAGFFLFLYLEVLDASFSFDGVIGAFAISSDIVIIALGLGIGAMYIRSTTIYLVRKGTLAEYRHLEHGAMWAIGALAVILLLSLSIEIPEVVTGLIGVVFIVAALITSVIANRNDPDPSDDEQDEQTDRPDPEETPDTEPRQGIAGQLGMTALGASHRKS